ncbi:MAG: site-2 protease family protein [Anaerolineaceae bacterium]|jgi:membrane-associated protease RseP (regulator of RpoE activity)|nr:site-2 protease family protein [Anaerolineaceae bacterium]
MNEITPKINHEALHKLVERIFQIDDITIGDPKKDYILRYRGMLKVKNSEEAYDELAKELKPLGITPLFRWEGKRHVIILIPGLPEMKRANPWVNLVLFILTVLSVLLTGVLFGMQELPPEGTGIGGWAVLLIRSGWPFAVSMMAILGAHEFGHYFMGRHHGVHVTLPYFIPFPFSQFGTMGAFIRMKEIPRNRKVLLDIGIAGPLAGLVVAIPVLFLGLSLSELSVLPTGSSAEVMFQMEGNSILYLLAKYITFGRLLPAPAVYPVSPVLHWLRYFFTGQPIPWGGMDVMMSSVAWAGWAGLLVTAMNLMPVGQLDGGHVMYVLIGRERAQKLYPIVLMFLVGLGFVWSGWWLWALLLFFMGRRYAEPLDQITPLDGKRKRLALLALVVFVLTFTPVPLMLF